MPEKKTASSKTNKTIGYLRVSTSDQNCEKNKNDIRLFAYNNDLGKVEFVEETASGTKNWKDRKLNQIVEDLQAGDRLIVPELSRLGRSTLQVLEILKNLKDKDVSVYSVKEGFKLNGDIQSKIMSTMLSLFSELERDFISQRTKEALKARKAAGVKLGRPKGPGKSKLDEYREEIIALLKNGSTKAFIAKKYGTTRPNLHNWLKMNNIEVKADDSPVKK